MQLTERYTEPSLLKRLNLQDWMFAALIVLAAGFAGNVTTCTWMATNRHSRGSPQRHDRHRLVLETLRLFMPIVGGIALFATQQYAGNLASGQHGILAQISDRQPASHHVDERAVFLATGTYWLALLSLHLCRTNGHRSDMGATGMGFIGMLVRWYESYLIGTDVGHIPVSNLYEVFVLFCLITALLYSVLNNATQSAAWRLCPAGDQRSGRLSAVVHAGTPGSYHPAADPGAAIVVDETACAGQFVGYGAFSLSAMLGVAYLLEHRRQSEKALPCGSGLCRIALLPRTASFANAIIGPTPVRQ